MASILAVFLPSFFMTGVGQQLFVPLSLAVGFAMIASYLLSSTLVPVLSAWIIRRPRAEGEGGFFHRLRAVYSWYLGWALKLRWPVIAAYALGAAVLILLLAPRIGTEIFPTVDAGQFQLRLRAPTGTRIERTELLTLQAMDLIRDAVGPG